MKVITFHNPDEENGCFSNWYLSDFTIGDVKYTSLEQYMMHQKLYGFTMKILRHRYLQQMM